MLDRCTEANSDCDIALKLNPDNARAWHTKRIALYRLGRFEEAVRSCNRALEIDPVMLKAQEYRILACRSLCGDCMGVQGNSDIGGPNMAITDFIIEDRWNVSLGAYADCTITLANFGATDGIANLSLIGDNGRELNSFVAVVPKNSIIKMTSVADTTIDDKKITCRINQVKRIS